MQSILVTGATGFLGSALVRQLVVAGESVKALVRPTSDRRNLTGIDVELVLGDITDRASLDAALAGCDRVYHVAGLYDLLGRPARDYYQVNVVGTRNVLAACHAAGVNRVVYSSTIAAIGSAPPGRPTADEESWWDYGSFFVPYITSKYIAEFEAWRWAARGLDLVVVNPGIVIGPGDRRPTPNGRLILAVLRGHLPIVPDLPVSLVDVDDVARGQQLAMARGRRGERYILTGENISLFAAMRQVAEIAGVRPPPWSVPPWGLRALAKLSKVSPIGWGILACGDYLIKTSCYDSSKAERELGWRASPLRDALARAITWFRDNGYWQSNQYWQSKKR